MSLLCNECEHDLQPSSQLPGREGTLVYPNLLSVVYVPGKDGSPPGFHLEYKEVKDNRSLCLACIEGAIPDDRKNALRAVYEAFEAEMRWRGLYESHRDMWISTDTLGVDAEAYETFKEKRKPLHNACLTCGGSVKTGKPFFVARVIDRVVSSDHLSLSGSYSFSNLETGGTSFPICFDDFQARFPRTFEVLGLDLCNELPSRRGMDQLYISPEFEAAISSVETLT